jgi:predicted nucleic acid-binding protein
LSAGELVTAETHGTATSRDPKDNKFLALAVSGQADYLITGDEDLLVLKSIGAIPIVSPAEFLAKINETGP